MDKDHPSKVNKMSHSLNPFKVPSTHPPAPKKSNITVNSDIIMIMDSDGTHIYPDLLYPIEGSTHQKLFCHSLKMLMNFYKTVRLKKFQLLQFTLRNQ